MDQPLVPYLANRLIHGSPALLTYLVGIVLAFAYRRRCRRPATLALGGLGVLFVSPIVLTVIDWCLFNKWLAERGSVAEHNRTVAVLSWAATACHAVGVALLVAAVFVGRTPTDPQPR